MGPFLWIELNVAQHSSKFYKALINCYILLGIVYFSDILFQVIQNWCYFPETIISGRFSLLVKCRNLERRKNLLKGITSEKKGVCKDLRMLQ